MAETIVQIEPTDSFSIWVDHTNEIAEVITNRVLTTNSHANGAVVSGNGFVVGNFGASNLVATNLRGGTIENPSDLTIISNTEFTGDKLVAGDIEINSSGIFSDSLPLNTNVQKFNTIVNAVVTTEIDNFDKTIYGGGDYSIVSKDLNDNQFQITKILAVHVEEEAYVSEYGIVYSNTNLGTISANANSTHCRIYLTPTIANTGISGTKVLVDV